MRRLTLRTRTHVVFLVSLLTLFYIPASQWHKSFTTCRSEGGVAQQQFRLIRNCCCTIEDSMLLANLLSNWLLSRFRYRSSSQPLFSSLSIHCCLRRVFFSTCSRLFYSMPLVLSTYVFCCPLSSATIFSCIAVTIARESLCSSATCSSYSLRGPNECVSTAFTDARCTNPYPVLSLKHCCCDTDVAAATLAAASPVTRRRSLASWPLAAMSAELRFARLKSRSP